jgi:hypothetical protein
MTSPEGFELPTYGLEVKRLYVVFVSKKGKKIKGLKALNFKVVPEVGLEPTRLAAHDFESRSSANSDTLAQIM